MSFALVTLALSAFGASAMSEVPSVGARNVVATIAGQYMASKCHVGLSVAARIGRRSYFFNYGSTDRHRAQRPTPDSVYELASVTKTFTGALAARAVVERRMTLDADFRAYLPGHYPNLVKDGRSFSLRQLATHMSGLQRDLPDSDALLAKPDYDRIGHLLIALNKEFGRAESLQALHGVQLRSAPGTGFAYSNLGIRVIGYGLEEAWRMPLERLLERQILSPLRMKDTRFVPTPLMRRRLVTPYSRNGHIQPYHDESAGAAYGLYSTPRDMARYLQWQLGEQDPVIGLAHGLLHGTKSDGLGLIWKYWRRSGKPDAVARGRDVWRNEPDGPLSR